MPEFCTCGAQLPPDAVFCHKCGKPQREIAAVEAEPAPPVPDPVMPPPMIAAPAEARSLNFRNGEAFKTALLAAILATLLFFIPYVNWLAAGYFSVFFYRRRTGSAMNIVSGVRLGWITGLLTFGILAILMTGSLLVLRSPGVKEMIEVLAQKDNGVQQMLGVMQNGPQLLGMLATLFVFVTFLSMTG